MPYGILKADTLTYYTATGDVSIAISGLAISGSPLISGVSGIFTTSVSGATVTGDAGQFTTITGGTAQFTNITGVSGTFTSRISGATVTGTSGQFTTLTATTGVFTSVSGGTVSGDVGLFNTISGNQGVFNSSLSVPSGTAASPSISFNGDPNTGIYSSGADQVAISTNGTGRLFVDSAGNVGIGRTALTGQAIAAQGAKGITSLTSSTGTNGVYHYFQNTGGTFYLGLDSSTGSDFGATYAGAIYHYGNYPIVFGTNGSERMRLDSSGRLGLGSSSPLYKLQIEGSSSTVYSGSARNTLLGVYNPDTTSGAYAGIELQVAGAGNASLANISAIDAGSGSTDVAIGVRNSNTFEEKVRIKSSGAVGIGTTSPAFGVGDGLEVARSGVSTIRVSSNTQGVELRSDAGTGTLETRGAFPLLFGIQGTERARIDSSGRLLVGTSTSPTVGDAQYGLLRTQGNTSTSSGFGLLSIARGLAPASITSGAEIGYIHFTANDGSPFARIECSADANAGVNDYPGRLVFSTTADGASSPTERVRISQNGVVTVKNGAVAEIGTLTDGATVTPDFAANCNFTLTISGNRTLANPTNITAGQTGSIFIIQGTGSNALSWGSYWDFTGGTAPTLSTASGAVDRVDYVVRTSTSIHTVFTANYS
jgi:hypothetical protein